MRRLLAYAMFAALLVLPATAQAKGPVAATIDGPGTGGGISIGRGGDTPVWIGTIAQQSGLFPAVFPATPDPMLEAQPPGDLGPRYTVTYNLPGPNGQENRIRQDLYPYAPKGPVTYTAPGQRFFGTQSTHGGWYQAAPALKYTLVKAGLPRTAPSGGSGDEGNGLTDFWPAVAGAFALGLVGLTVALMRRRPRTATT
jgi:hypothetical protein